MANCGNRCAAELLLFAVNLILNSSIWTSDEQVRRQCIVGKSLVKHFMDHYMPKATASNWSDVPSAVALMVENIHNLSGGPP